VYDPARGGFERFFGKQIVTNAVPLGEIYEYSDKIGKYAKA
jgi:hypothetical protein